MSERTQFAICIHNGEYAGTLELRKVYEVLSDPTAAQDNFMRVIDEFGEDYLYPESWFVRVAVPENVEQLLHELVLNSRSDQPIAEIRPIDTAHRPRPFGLAAGTFLVPDDFDDPLPEEILKAFEG